MDRLVSIPIRVFGVKVRGELESLRVASKFSIPKRVLSLKSLLQAPTTNDRVYHIYSQLILFMSLDSNLIYSCYDTS
jgi:hypothetical protein